MRALLSLSKARVCRVWFPVLCKSHIISSKFECGEEPFKICQSGAQPPQVLPEPGIPEVLVAHEFTL